MKIIVALVIIALTAFSWFSWQALNTCRSDYETYCKPTQSTTTHHAGFGQFSEIDGPSDELDRYLPPKDAASE